MDFSLHARRCRQKSRHDLTITVCLSSRHKTPTAPAAHVSAEVTRQTRRIVAHPGEDDDASFARVRRVPVAGIDLLVRGGRRERALGQNTGHNLHQQYRLRRRRLDEVRAQADDLWSRP